MFCACVVLCLRVCVRGGEEGAQMCTGTVMGPLVVLRGVWVPDVRAGGALSKAALVTKRQSAEIAF